MKRVAKHAGVGNIVIEEVPIPEVGSREILVRAKASLISRGSEIGMRYLNPAAVDPNLMGYSLAGIVERVGDQVTEFHVGQRVTGIAPHAEYVVVSADPQYGLPHPPMMPIPDNVSFEAATFVGLTSSAVMWSWIPEIRANETVVILGQGLVGSLVLQAIRLQGPDRIIAVESIPLRAQLARRFGADAVVDPSQGDPVTTVKALNGGDGVQVVIEAVGGKSGLTAFTQGMNMLDDGGRMILIGLYQGAPLPLDANQVMRKRIIGGVQPGHRRKNQRSVAMELIAHGLVRPDEMITHRVSATRAGEAFHLLYNHIEQTMAVLLIWD